MCTKIACALTADGRRLRATQNWRAHFVALRCGLLLLLFPVDLASILAERAPIKVYTTADGLAHDRVKRVVRDPRGFLWFCTADGLSRFDGYRFLNFGSAEGLPHLTINDLIVSHSGKIYWIATDGGGVCRFDSFAPGKPMSIGPRGSSLNAQRQERLIFEVFRVGDSLPANSVNVLYEDQAGRIWAGTDAGLFVMNPTENRFAFSRVTLGLISQPHDLLHVWALMEDREGTLWIGTSSGLVRRLSDGRVIHYPIHPSQGQDHVWGLLQDTEGRFWVGHDAALLVFKPEPPSSAAVSERLALWVAFERFERRNRLQADSSKTVLLPLPSSPGEVSRYGPDDGLLGNSMGPLYQSSDGGIWVGNSGGLSVFKNGRFRSYTSSQGLSEGSVIALAEDRDGNLWGGTQGSGAVKIARNGLVSYSKADGLGHNLISSIFENRAGELHVISGYWYVSLFREGRFITGRPQLSKSIAPSSWQMYQATIQDHLGEWWIATGEGLFRFPRVKNIVELGWVRPKAVYTTKDGLAGNDVSCLFEDSQGDIWIGCRSLAPEVLTRWERTTESFHRYSTKHRLPSSNVPTSICEDRAGNLWVGFLEGGLACHRRGLFRLLTEADGIPAGTIQKLYVDRAGRLWVATSRSGVGCIEKPSADQLLPVIYTTAQGLASNNVSSITEDQWGHIYFGTPRGVDRLSPATGRIKHYAIAEGLANNEVVAAFEDQRGMLWFGTRKGLSTLSPEPDRPGSPPPILIDGLRVAGATQQLSPLGESRVAGLELSSHRNYVQIDFLGLSFAAGERLRYQYRIQGVDDDWSSLTDQRTVNYAGLPPGRHRFLVRAVNAEGVNSTIPAEVLFTILPPIWRRGWFLALSGIVTALAVYQVYRYRVARLIELERVRTRIAADLHDDIGSSLSRIAILSEVQKVSPDASGKRLKEIADTARALVDSMSDIVWSIDPRLDDLGSVILRAREFAADVLESRGIHWDVQVPQELERLKLRPDQRRHLLLIFKEAVTNAASHAECSLVSLSLDFVGHELRAEIRDDGCGFKTGQPEKPVVREHGGHGLENMRSRIEELGGCFNVNSSPGSGTRLSLTIPTKRGA